MTDYLPVADQIQILFEAVLRPDGHPYTMREVSEQIDVSIATISQMRSGRIKNPQLNTLRALCHFFNVPLAYFETRTIDECYAVLASESPELPDEANEIVYHVKNLTPASQRDVLTIIKWVQAAQRQQANDPTAAPLPNLDIDDER